jgi:hypothetical protein
MSRPRRIGRSQSRGEIPVHELAQEVGRLLAVRDVGERAVWTLDENAGVQHDRDEKPAWRSVKPQAAQSQEAEGNGIVRR